ncbi:hypothetical protein AOX55_00006372 (plasmid) [Sinorhizobium fredii CCBAU 25509]|nr:hypothetical protein AOX55_00006372 [Sinorhizobium fredii CCBAU 25509]
MHRIEPRRSALVAANLLIGPWRKCPLRKCNHSGAQRHWPDIGQRAAKIVVDRCPSLFSFVAFK